MTMYQVIRPSDSIGVVVKYKPTTQNKWQSVYLDKQNVREIAYAIMQCASGQGPKIINVQNGKREHV